MEWKRIFAVLVLLSLLLGMSISFGLSIINVSRQMLQSISPTLLSDSTSLISVEPVMVINETLQSGSHFAVYVNVSDVTDLYTWHVKLSWDETVLNASQLLYGDFLGQTVSPNGTSADVANITGIFHDDGYAWIAESVLGEYPGINGSGRLLEIEFEVVGYGHTAINVNVTQDMPTELLDSTPNSITFTTADGYFRNTIPGDMTDDTPETPPSPPDGDVDRYDLGEFADAYGSNEGDPNYNILADLMGDNPGDLPDGDVDRYDLGVFADNYGRTI